MAKIVYCSNCGQRLEITRKALKGYGRIIDLIPPHECSEEPQELDLTPIEIPTKAEGKFVRNLDDLKVPSVSTADLRDRRPSQDIKSTAPASLLKQMKTQTNTLPERELVGGEPEGGE